MPDKDEIKDEHISQQESGVLPTWLQLDKAFEKMDADESPFLKNLGIEITSNPNLNLGMDPPSQEGQNWLVMTPIRSNTPVPNLPALPVGYNKNIGGMESTLTHELLLFHIQFKWESLYPRPQCRYRNSKQGHRRFKSSIHRHTG